MADKMEDGNLDLEKILQTEQQRFSDMFAQAPVSMCILKGRDHAFEKANGLYYSLSGRSESILGKPIRQVFPEAEGQGIFELLDNVYNTGLIFTTTERLVRLDVNGDGNLKDIYLNFMFQPYRNNKGEVEGIFYFGVDVTEQIQARKRIEESEGRYRQIVETTQEGIWLIDENNRTVFTNKRMADMRGTTQKEMLAGDIYSILNENAKFFAEAGLKETELDIEGGKEFRHVTKNGEVVWFHLFASRVSDKNGKYSCSLGMFTDITKRKLYKQELLKLSLIARRTVNPVAITDAKDNIEWVNEAFSRITEFSPEQAKEKKMTDLLSWNDANPAVIRFINSRVLDLKPFECELLQYTRSGRPIWMEIHGQPILDDNGNLTHYFYISTDVTERKHAFEKLTKTENEIRMFARQLNTVLEDERSRIAREIHDEFGQQLAGLKMSLSSLARFGNFQGDSGERIMLDMMRGIDNTIESLRNFSMELRPGILDTLGLIPSLEWLLRGFEKKTGILCSMIVNVRKQIFEKELSTTYFRICQEALTNIIKHARAGEVTIDLAEVGDELSLTIADNGKGIDGEKLENPFSLGLLGMRERAKLIGAQLTITSETGMGTQVNIKARLIQNNVNGQ